MTKNEDLEREKNAYKERVDELMALVAARDKQIEVLTAKTKTATFIKMENMRSQLEQAEVRKRLDEEHMNKMSKTIGELMEQVNTLKEAKVQPPISPDVELQAKVSKLEDEARLCRQKIKQVEAALEEEKRYAKQASQRFVEDSEARAEEIRKLRAEHKDKMFEMSQRTPEGFDELKKSERALRTEASRLQQRVSQLEHKTVLGVYQALTTMASNMARLGRFDDGSNDASFQPSVHALVRSALCGQDLTGREVAEHVGPVLNDLNKVYVRACEHFNAEILQKGLSRASGGKRQRQ